MRAFLRWTIPVVIIAVIAAGLGIGLYRAKKHLASAPVWTPRPAPVETAQVTEGDLSRTIRYLGRLEAVATTEIAPKISARIVSLQADEGDVVAKGDLLAQLDDRDIQSQIAALEADIAAARARLAGARAVAEAARNNLAFAKREYERDKTLFEKNGISGSVLEESRNQFDDARGKASQAEEAVKRIEQEIAARQAQLAEARTNLSYAKIRTDYGGTIRKRYAEVGDMAMPGKSVFDVLDISSRRLCFDMVQEDLAHVRAGQPVRIQWPSAVGAACRQSRIARIFPSLESNQTVRAEIDLSCAFPEKLKIGSLVPLNVIVENGHGLIIPQNALVPTPDGGQLVYAVRGGRLEQVPVEVVFRNEDQVLIRGAVSSGEALAKGEYLQWVRLHDGMAVAL